MESGRELDREIVFQPIHARSQTFVRAVGPQAYDCVRLTFVRSGEAELFGEWNRQRVTVGDVLVLGPSILCGSEPDDHLTVTTLMLDTDYVVDQVFWQYADLLESRSDAAGFAETLFTEPFQVLRLGEQRAGLLMPWLDELAALCVDGKVRARFHRAQALWFAIADVIAPFISVSATRLTSTQCVRAWPSSPHAHRLQELRAEARNVASLLRSDIARKWSLDELASLVHLSPSQLGRVFSEAYGKPPIAYLTTLRAEKMATLLRTTDEPISRVAKQVGWSNPDYATRQFRRNIGINPTEYRSLIHKPIPSVDPTYIRI